MKKGYAAVNVVLQRMPEGMKSGCLIFHGAPDLIVNHKPVMLAGVDMCQDGCIEDKNDSSVPYNPASIIPDQAGQLVACIYEFMVATCLRHILDGQDCTSVLGYGLYMIRNGDVLKFVVRLDQTGMMIQAKYYTSHNKSMVMCKAFNDFISM